MSQIPRIYLQTPLRVNDEITITDKQFHYLANVLRKKTGDNLLVFNGVDGEFLCEINKISNKKLIARIINKTKAQSGPYNLHYFFAPLKRERLDYLMQKATEMGAGIIQPVITEYTQVKKIKADRIIANTIEAAEQCGINNIPKVLEEITLFDLIENFDEGKILFFCDEYDFTKSDNQINSQSEYNENSQLQPLNKLEDIINKFEELKQKMCENNATNINIALIVGPEGGFSENERKALYEKDYVIPISFGPRIMRADTAAVAAFSLIQSLFGDWYL